MSKILLTKRYEKALKKYKDNNAFSDYKGNTYTYSQVAKKVLFLHHFFDKMNIKPGDKIALLGKNNAHWAMTYIATITYGAVIVPILPDFHPSDMTHIVNHSDSKILLVEESIFEQLDEQNFLQTKIVLNVQDFSCLQTTKKAYSWRLKKVQEQFETEIAEKVNTGNFSFNIKDDELAELIYTSGTTGFSKGVMLPHRSLRANVDFAIETLPVKAGDPILSFLPLAHAYGCAFEFLYPFAIGAHITFLSKVPSPKIILKAFSEIKPKLILSVPLIIEKIYQRQIKPIISQSKMKLMLKLPIVKEKVKQKICKKLTDAFGGEFIELIIGGAPLSREVDLFLKEIGFRFLVGYGMSECGPLISYEKPANYRAGTVGKCIPGLSVRIDTPNEDGVGEIQVKGENVMIGYYKNEQATAATFMQDGWLKTGDLGVLDEEKNIIIRGRSKSLLLGASGQNIYPEVIESMMNNLEIVAESLVIQRNNQLVALVYPDYEKVDKQHVSHSELEKKIELSRQTMNQKLPAYSKLQKIEIMNLQFEKTPTKKIKRYLYQG